MLTVRFAHKPGGDGLAVGARPGGSLLPTAAAIAEADLLRAAFARSLRFKGEEGEVLPVFCAAGWRVLVGMGAEADVDSAGLRRIGGALFAELAGSGATELGVALDLDPDQAAELAYGMRIRAWRPAARYRTKPDPEEAWSLRAVTVQSAEPRASERRYSHLAAVADGAVLARDLVIAPGNELNPESYAKSLKKLDKLGIGVEIVDAERHGLRLLHAVGQGSAFAPRLAVLTWSGGRRGDPPVALVGKGITFDTGGIDIKPSEDLHEMKGDMAGSAAVVGAMVALASRNAAVNAVGILAIAENMVSGRATRPGDIVKSHAGLTVEIIDTDAEGRLALADALSYAAARFKPKAMVDLATLTGAIEVSLGHHRAGLFTADDDLAAALSQAGEAEDELLWRMPLTDAYDEALKSLAADLRNCDWEHGPDALHAARFLQHFVPPATPWAHLDIAGMSEAQEDGPLAAEGPNGFGVRLLDRWLADNFER